MQDVWISVKSIKNLVNRHYGFMPYVAVCSASRSIQISVRGHHSRSGVD